MPSAGQHRDKSINEFAPQRAELRARAVRRGRRRENAIAFFPGLLFHFLRDVETLSELISKQYTCKQYNLTSTSPWNGLPIAVKGPLRVQFIVR